MKPKIVFLDQSTLGEGLDFSPFAELGHLELFPSTDDPQKTITRLKNAQIAIINKIVMDESTLSQLPDLKLICLTATGYDNVDLKAAKKLGIGVTNAAGYSTDSVAQHTLAMVLHLMEPMSYWDHFVKSGAYSTSGAFTHWGQGFHELAGKTWGILGMGAIGQKVAAIASALGAKVQYFSTNGVDRCPSYPRVEWNPFLSSSDILSVHAPLNERTEKLMDYHNFCRMKASSLFLNLGRGGIVHLPGLIRALEEKRIAKAALDVYPQEPLEANSPLLRFQEPNRLLLTPHVAWGSFESRSRCMKEVFLNILAYLKGERRSRVD